MKNEIDLKNYSIRSDLIIDNINETDVPSFKKHIRNYENVEVTDIEIDSNSAKTISKKEGTYLTIKFKDVTDRKNKKEVIEVVVKEIENLFKRCNIKKDDKVLIIGLGNKKSTPDSLGPKVADDIFVTKYLFDIDKTSVEEGIRNVSSFIPGVMGTTGIESSDVILGLVDKTKPDFLIVIDALASSSIDRVNKTIQITDTGIHPGSGVGNARKEISFETIKIPVIAIGIPTVVDAVTIVSDTFFYLQKQMSYTKENYQKGSHKLTPITSRNYENHKENLSTSEKKELLGMIGNLDEEEVKRLIFEVLTPIGYNLMVTPKEVDFIIDTLSEVISRSLNKVLHTKDLSNETG